MALWPRPPTPPEVQKLQTALSTGGKIEAIKLCREFTGMGLAEAKAFVENLPLASLDKSGDAAGKLSGSESGPITAEIFAGNKIQAIKLYREAYPGTGLAEAKEAIEKLAEQLYAKHPEKFIRPPQSGGCASVLVFGLLLSMLAWYFIAG